jgi:hypothetical protein
MALPKPVWPDADGQDIAEWALIVAFLLVFAIGILKLVGVIP